MRRGLRPVEEGGGKVDFSLKRREHVPPHLYFPQSGLREKYLLFNTGVGESTLWVGPPPNMGARGLNTNSREKLQ